MSTQSDITLAKQPSFSDLSGGESGYGVCFANTNASPRPNYAGMTTKAACKTMVERLALHVKSIVDSFNTENLNGDRVSHIKIGKSHVKSKGKNLKADDPKTWVVAGVPKRWTSYKKDGYSALIVFECFTRADVPNILNELGFDQQDLGLKFEDHVLQEVKAMQKIALQEKKDRILAKAKAMAKAKAKAKAKAVKEKEKAKTAAEGAEDQSDDEKEDEDEEEDEDEDEDDDEDEDCLLNVTITNKDDGGGGKRSTTYAGFVLYVALKVEVGSDTDSSGEESD